MKFKSCVYAPILFGVILILTGIASTLVQLVDSASDRSFLATAIIQLLVFLLPLAFYYRVRGLNPAATLKFSKVAPQKFSFLFVVALIFVVGVLLFRYVGLFHFETAFVKTPGILQFPIQSQNRFLILLCSILLPAFLEEILFRGVLLEEYRSYGAVWAVGISALMFAMAHLSFENFLFYLFEGVIFGVIAVASNSMIPTLVLHLMFNLSDHYFRPLVVEYLRQAGKSPLLPYLLLAIFIFLFFLLFSRLENIYQDKAYDEMLQSRKELLRKELESVAELRSDEKELSSGEKLLVTLKEIFLSPSFLVSCAVFVFLALDLI